MQSISRQSEYPIEHIIINWSDHKGSLVLKRDFKKSSPYLTLAFKLRDNGIYMAMNFGIILSSGNYLLFLNAGDELYEERALELLAMNLPTKPEKIHYHFPFVYKRSLSSTSYDIIGYSSIRSAITSGSLICQQSILFNRELLILRSGFDESYSLAGDYEFICRSLKSKDIWGTLPVVGTVYEAGGLSETRQDECSKEISRARVQHASLFL